MKQSGGTLLYWLANSSGDLETRLHVLLVHPSGNYNRKAPWSIPKGEPDEGESFIDAARRETVEETAVQPPEKLVSLGSVQYRRSRKEIYAFAGEVVADCQAHCNSWEVDRAEFVSLKEARSKLHPDQVAFLDRLLDQFAAEPFGES